MELAEVVTPHIGGILKYIRWDKKNKILKTVASAKTYSTHDIGTKNLSKFAVTDWDQDGIAELILPNQSKNELMMVKRTTKGLQNVTEFSLNGSLSTNVTLLSIQGYTGIQSIIAAGTKEGRLILWIN